VTTQADLGHVPGIDVEFLRRHLQDVKIAPGIKLSHPPLPDQAPLCSP
jgi:hypothetical protein